MTTVASLIVSVALAAAALFVVVALAAALLVFVVSSMQFRLFRFAASIVAFLVASSSPSWRIVTRPARPRQRHFNGSREGWDGPPFVHFPGSKRRKKGEKFARKGVLTWIGEFERRGYFSFPFFTSSSLLFLYLSFLPYFLLSPSTFTAGFSRLHACEVDDAVDVDDVFETMML